VPAQKAYADFLERYALDENAPYAQLQRARSLSQRLEKPDRDQTATIEALVAFKDLVRRYPTSELAASAHDEIRRLEDHLAEHEIEVGRYLLRTRSPGSAIERFRGVERDFPNYSQMDKLLFHLARAYEQAGQDENAVKTRERLSREFPDSRYAK
jgi:outer membrane protein assembly factor BamD